MSRPDVTAAAALNAGAIRPAFFCYLDILGDPLRATTAGQSIAFGAGATGDVDLDGFTFDGIDPKFVDIGPVRQKDGGADAITCKLSGLIDLDATLLNLIGNIANWQGRTARMWRTIRNEVVVQQGAIQPLITGWMTSLVIGGSPESQTINLTIQPFLAAFTGASGRSYLDQARYDAGDLSARASIALANGLSGNPLVNATPASTDGGQRMTTPEYIIRKLGW